MKYLIFVTWLYFQILLVQCDIFVNNLNGSDTSIKMCIQKTINNLFSENDTLNLFLNGNDLCEDAIFEMSPMRQYMVLNMEMGAINNDVNKLRYDGEFIICPEDLPSLKRTIHNARHIRGRTGRIMGDGNVLVIANTTDASSMFKLFWLYRINNVIILVYGQGISKLLTCNRFAPENECGKTAQLMVSQDCEEQSLSFTKVIHQMNKCPVTFMVPMFTVYQNPIHVSARAVQYIIVELSHHLNATFQRTMFFDAREYNHLILTTGLILISIQLGDKDTGIFDITKPLTRADVVWLVPKAKQISNVNVCVKVFNYDVWIATSVVFITVWLMWFLIISFNGGFTFNKLCLSFLNVWSLTICGNVVSQLPRSLALRIILLFYLFYAINMQFAFTSDMSTVLTAPQYEFQIRNLDELADSQLPVYISDNWKKDYFKKNYTNRKMYTKLQNSLHVATAEEYVNHLLNLHLHRNYAIVSSLQDIRNLEMIMKRTIEAYEITDTSITPPSNNRLFLLINHYFTTTLNTFIGRMIESGIYEKRKNDIYLETFGTKNVDTTPQDDLLTLKHLIFIFVFFGFGLCTACVVFCFELVLHKYL